MTLDQIDRVVRQANPVPDLSALEPFDASVLDQQRRTEMQTHDRVIVDDEGDEPKRGRNLLIGIAAAAAIIIGALLLLPPLTSDAPVADQPSTTSAVETATAFVEAYKVNFDIDRAFAYLAADAEGVGLIEEERLLARLLQAIGNKTTVISCDELSASPTGSLVSCSFAYHSLRSDEMGMGPYGGGSYELTVLDQKITSVEEKFPPNFFSNPNGFSEQIWVPFAVWIGATYPEDGVIMYADWPNVHSWATTEQSITLWEQRSREYVEVVLQRRADAVDVATSFIEAFFGFDVDLAATYLAPDADLTNFERDGASWQMNNRLMQAWGWKVFLESCEATGAEVIAVSCPFATHTLHSDEMDLEPFGDNTFDIAVEEGQIVSAAWQLAHMTNGFNTQVWRPFTQWMAQNHPEDGPVMFTDWPMANNEAVTEESIALWEQRSREYADFVGG